jgi:general secretion pathway protein D
LSQNQNSTSSTPAGAFVLAQGSRDGTGTGANTVDPTEKEAHVAIKLFTTPGTTGRQHVLAAMLTLAVLLPMTTSARGSEVPPAQPQRDMQVELRDPIGWQIARHFEELKVTVSFNNTPLCEVVRALKAVSGDDLSFVFDNQALQEEGISLDQPLTQTLYAVPMRSALNILLNDVGLTWVIQNDAITITTPAHARGKSRTVTYAVADLVVPVENHPSPLCLYNQVRCRAAACEDTPGGGAVAKPEAGPCLEEALIRLITHTVAPESWSDAGGKGTIQYYPLGLALVVNQTQDVHEQIIDLLQALRRLQEVEIAIEVRVLSVSENFLQHSSLDFVAPANSVVLDLATEGCRMQGLTLLDDTQLRLLFEAAQGDRRTNIMQMPRITLFNGQTGNINVGEEPLPCDNEPFRGGHPINWPRPKITVFNSQTTEIDTGDELQFLDAVDSAPAQPSRRFCCASVKVTPLVSADRRSVRLDLHAAWEDQTVYQTWNQKLVVPDGCTMLIGSLKPRVEEHNGLSLPVRDKGLPRKVVGSDGEAQRLLLLVTARVIVNEEKEQEAFDNLPRVPR